MVRTYNSQRAETRMYVVFLIPAVVLLVILTAYPILSGMWHSMTNYHLARPAAATFIGFENFRNLMSNHEFFIVIRNTVLFVIGAVSMQFVLGFAFALLLNRKMRYSGFIRTLLILPLAMTPVVVGLLWYLLYNPTSGLINSILRTVGGPTPSWLGRPNLAMFSLIVSDGWHWTPFVMLLMLAGLQSIPKELYEAAELDGAGRLRVFFQITLPLVVPISGVVLLFRTMDAFKVFDKVFVLTGGGPGMATETLVFHAYQAGFAFFRIGYASAISLIAFFIVLFAAIFIIRTTQDKDLSI